MTAIEILLERLIDYAGLYPPASLDMRAAVRSYLEYASSKDASALGHFIVDLNRLPELRAVAGDSLQGLRLSVIGPGSADWESLPSLIDEGLIIDAIEIKTDQPSKIERISPQIPPAVAQYYEVPVHLDATEALDSIAAAGARAKLRMGGIVAEAFPSTMAIVTMLKELSERSVPFKATAGLHHPVRSRHPLTYAPDSPIGTMHGFFNLLCAAALIYFDGDKAQAQDLLNEERPAAWRVTPEAIEWRSFQWSSDQLREVRQRFFISFGSCSFVEPLNDMEALGWP